MHTRLVIVALTNAALLVTIPVFCQQSADVPVVPVAALGTAFTYQGRLTDGGSPANGTYDLQLRLFDALAGGGQVGGTIVKEDVAVADGLFGVDLDFGASVYTGQALWLEIGVRPGASSGAFSVLSPPQPLNPAPFAHYSKAGVATDVQCAGCVSVGDLAGGSASSGQVLIATGASTMDWQEPAWPTGSGSTGQVAFWSGSSALSGNANLFWDNTNGRLGIGTAAPRESLEVAGNIRMPDTTSAPEGALYLGTAPFLHAWGSNNAFVGARAGNFTMGGGGVDGRYNSGFGNWALHADTTGGSNTAVGYTSLGSNTDGDFNVAVGSWSLPENTTGSGNAALGHMALLTNTTGGNNVAVGVQSLWSNTVGADNVAVGGDALMYNTTAGRNTAVGRYALNTQSYDNGGAAWDAANTAIGFYALYSNQPTSTTVGRRNTAVGGAAGDSKTVTNSTFVGYDSDASVDLLTNATALGYGAKVDASNKVVIGNSAVTSIGGYTTWSNYSDRRGKRDIRDLDLGLDLVLRLRPVEFRLANGNGKLDYGFVAQEVEALLGDDSNVVDVGGDPDHTLALRYSELIAPLVKAVQEQQAQIEAKSADVAALRAALAEKDRHAAEQDALIAELVKRVRALEETAGRHTRP